jgi:hypothetical protein
MTGMDSNLFGRVDMAGPPRCVPLLVRVRILFGGALDAFGWFFLGFGLIFVWVFVSPSSLTEWYTFRGSLERAAGRVVGVEKTGISVGGSRGSPGTPVYACRYQFQGPAERTYEGVSFTTGLAHKAGQAVTVEFPKGAPGTSRILGARTAKTGPLGLISLIFPLVGMAALLGGIPGKVRGVRLLRDGVQTTGVLVDKAPTHTRINNRTVYKLTFEFTAADGGKHQAVAKTHLVEKLEAEPRERLLYDPYSPSRAVMLDAMPGSPRIDENGQIRVDSVLKTLAGLVIPAAVIVGHGAYLLSRLK